MKRVNASWNPKADHWSVGKRFHRWRVLKYLGTGKVRAECQCGVVGIRQLWSFINGTSKSCRKCLHQRMRDAR